jgi:hypothetical protein
MIIRTLPQQEDTFDFTVLGVTNRYQEGEHETRADIRQTRTWHIAPPPRDSRHGAHFLFLKKAKRTCEKKGPGQTNVLTPCESSSNESLIDQVKPDG